MNCTYEKLWASQIKESKEKKNQRRKLDVITFSFVSYRTQRNEYVHTGFPHASLFQALAISKRSREGINVTPPKCSFLHSEDVNPRKRS